jgi:HIRAN domain
MVGRAGWTDKYASIEPTGTEPALRSTSHSQPSETSGGVEIGDAYAARVPDVDDEDPSDILRRVQAGMSAARLSVPLDKQIEIVGEQFYPKEIRKLFRECGMPITPAGCTLESEVCFLVPEPWNPHDPNAVAVMVRTFHVGHLPAALAKRYHGRLTSYAQRRQLVTGNARIWSQLESGGMVRARVTVVIPEAAVL